MKKNLSIISTLVIVIGIVLIGIGLFLNNRSSNSMNDTNTSTTKEENKSNNNDLFGGEKTNRITVGCIVNGVNIKVAKITLPDYIKYGVLITELENNQYYYIKTDGTPISMDEWNKNYDDIPILHDEELHKAAIEGTIYPTNISDGNWGVIVQPNSRVKSMDYLMSTFDSNGVVVNDNIYVGERVVSDTTYKVMFYKLNDYYWIQYSGSGDVVDKMSKEEFGNELVKYVEPLL